MNHDVVQSKVVRNSFIPFMLMRKPVYDTLKLPEKSVKNP